jgi:hypothetical protein
MNESISQHSVKKPGVSKDVKITQNIIADNA